MIPRVLLVDDHELVRTSIAMILNDSCEICSEAADGHEAVEKVFELRPDLVLLDLRPVMGGTDAAREIRRVSPETKIVYLSMYAPRTGVKLTTPSGADACVSKRCAVTDLYKTIAAVLQVPYEPAPYEPSANRKNAISIRGFEST